MICGECYGIGKTLFGYPCSECGGSGIIHCCEGLREQPMRELRMDGKTFYIGDGAKAMSMSQQESMNVMQMAQNIQDLNMKVNNLQQQVEDLQNRLNAAQGGQPRVDHWEGDR